jgi:hypothetical protein
LLFRAAGIPSWCDTASLYPGDDRHPTIRRAITEGALAFIPCFSSRSAARRASGQNDELLLAVSQMRRHRLDIPWLIPVRFDDCDIPDLELGAGRTLASIQRADLFGPGREQAAGRLVVAVQRLLRFPLPLVAEPTPPVPAPAAPVAVPVGNVTWIVEADPVLWLRSGPGKSFPTVGCLDYGQQARGNSSGVKGGKYTWYPIQGNDDGWAWGNGIWLRSA